MYKKIDHNSLGKSAGDIKTLLDPYIDEDNEGVSK